MVIDNRPGAGGNLALQAVARAPADGYTLLLVATPHAINVTLYEKNTVNVTGTSPRSPALTRTPSSCLLIRRFRPRQSLSSSPMPRQIPARSIWLRPEPET